MENFKKRQITFLWQLVSVSTLLFAVHLYVLHYFINGATFFFPIWHIYIFHAIITLIVYTAINYKYSSGKKDIFNLFMIMTFFKMVLTVLFLLPLLLSDFENKRPDVFNFFIPYFVFLFFEVYALTKFLRKT